MVKEDNSTEFLKYEKYFFLVVIFLHLIPLFAVTYFVTLDGPAHLYNANIIKNYFNGFGEYINQYFYFNPNPEPNWSGHFLFSVLLNFLPATITEKAVLALYVILLPVTFRMLVISLNPGAGLMSYLIFPFIYNLPFSFGFYNFSLGLPVMFYGIYYFINTRKFLWKESLIFLLLVLAAYFSHLFSCLLLLGITGSYFLVSMLKEKTSWRDRFQSSRPKIIVYLLAVVPVLVMVLFFLKEKGISGYKGRISSLPLDELVSYVFSTRSLICWIYDKELEVSKFMGMLLLVAIVLIIRSRIKGGIRLFSCLHDYWLLVGVIMLVLFFIVPDSIGSGGFISVRLLLYFHLFIITWIALQQFKPLPGFLIAIGSLFISFNLMSVHLAISDGLDNDANEMVAVIPIIKENSNVLPLNYSANWLHLNLSNYVGTAKNIIVLDNYEPNYPQFPLKWQPKAYPYNIIGNFASSNRPCIGIEAYEKKSGLKIDYLLRWQYSSSYADSCTLITNQVIHQFFEPVYTSPGKMAELFKRKVNN